jgi:prepilin-type N-terminal cleavage/methylation domain-containing protein
MKLNVTHRPQGQNRGFTLVELLIVIGLIATLAGVSVPVYNGIMRKMRETQARQLGLSVQNSVKGYYNEYMKYPLPPGGGGSEATAVMTDSTLVPALMAKDEVLNPRGVRFLPELKDATDSRKNGLVLTDGLGSIFDPWGGMYSVLMDSGDYNNELENPDTEATSPTLFQSVAVWSNGEDMKDTTWDDNISTWSTSVKDGRK